MSSLATPENPGISRSGSSSTDYEAILSESQSAEAIAPEEYAALADQIAQTRNYYIKQQVSPSEARVGLREIYVDDPEDRQLRDFSAVLIDLPYQASYQRWLDAHENGSAQSHEDRQRGRELAYARCELNNLLRTMLVEGRQSFDRAQVAEYMNKATNYQNPKFIQRSIKGSTSEIAFLDALKSMKNVSEARFTDTQTDFRGTDVLATVDGLRMAFDTKYDKQVFRQSNKQIDGEWVPHATIGVQDEAINNLGLSVWGQQFLTERINRARAVTPRV